jgi:hypothetical protein
MELEEQELSEPWRGSSGISTSLPFLWVVSTERDGMGRRTALPPQCTLASTAQRERERERERETHTYTRSQSIDKRECFPKLTK